MVATASNPAGRPSPADEAKILRTDTALESAVTWAQSGQVDLGTFLAWLCETPFDLAKSPILMGVLSAEDFGRVMQSQTRLIASAAAKSVQSVGALRLAVSKRGALSLYGINSRMPVTLYADQWERLCKYLRCPADNPISTFIASASSAEFPTSAFESKEEQAFLADVRAGKVPSHRINGDKVISTLSRKSA